MIDFIREMSRDELLKLVDVYAKNWLAHDGCWFLAAEEKDDMETAMNLDRESWRRFARAEAKRIMKTFDIPENGGLDALAKAFHYRLYAAINEQKIERPNDNTLIFKMIQCRVQEARRRKGLSDFPCKSVGIVEFSKFAETIDPQIETTSVQCPPDPAENDYCIWKFQIISKNKH